MPRYRTIKPEYWSSEQVMSCSRDARLLFIGIWNFCDDTGRLPASPKQIKAQVLPGDDDITVEIIQRLLDELSSNTLIRFYEVDAKRYLVVTGWHHQKIDRPQKSKHPAPLDDNSTSVQRTLAPEREKGEERKESKGESGARAKAATPIEDGWKPSAGTVSKAKALGLTDADLTKMVSRFVPHYRSKGEVSVDWDAKLESWLPDEAQKLGRKPPSAPVTTARFHIKSDSEQWRAWTKHLGKAPPQDSNFGWYFDTEWPPGHEQHKAAA